MGGIVPCGNPREAGLPEYAAHGVRALSILLGEAPGGGR